MWTVGNLGISESSLGILEKFQRIIFEINLFFIYLCFQIFFS